MTQQIETFISLYLPSWAFDPFAGHRLWQWMALILAILVGFGLKIIAESLVHNIKGVTSKKDETFIHQMILALERPIGLMVATAFWFLCTLLFGFQGTVREMLFGLTEILFGSSLIWAAYRSTDVFGRQLSKFAEKTESELDDQLVPFLVKAMKLAIVTIGPLIIIQNLGVNVMSLMAGLGLGGLAFALAAKDTAANLFGSLMIIIDRPFRIGDWIATTQGEGIVEDIGFRSTRIRSFYDSLISVPNSVLVVTQIDNLGQRKMRRIREELSLTYDTPPEKIEAFVEGLKNIVLSHPDTHKEKFHVVFHRFGSHSLDILLYCFVKVPDWASELVAKQNLYLEILRLSQALEVSFAFPTQTLLIESFPEKKPNQEPRPWTVEKLRQSSQDFAPGGASSRPTGLGLFRPHFQKLSEGSDSSS